MNIFVDAGSKNFGKKKGRKSVICAVSGDGELLFEERSGDHTNNEAEMLAIGRAFRWIKEKKITDVVTIWSDSRLAVSLINGTWHGQMLRIIEMKNRVKAQQPPNVIVNWIPRWNNLAGQVLEYGYIQKV